MSQLIDVTRINDHILLLDDNHESTGYLIIGKEKALLIDTMNGREDLNALVRKYTDLPLMVVNTHGHPDHIYGNVYFDKAYMNPDDWHVAIEFVRDPDFLADIQTKGLTMPPFEDIHPGDVIDLGDLHLEIYGLCGHTPGSILLLLKEDRILFTGDAINHHLWMQLHHSTSIQLFHDNLLKVMHLSKEADYILHGHATGLDDISLMDKTLKATEEILAGSYVDDSDYIWFGGKGKQHPIPGDDGVICYVPVPERVNTKRAEWAASDAKRDAGLEEPENLKKYKNISYGIFGDSNMMDIYIPTDSKYENKLLPVLLNVHGGGYFYGDKELYRFFCMDLAEHGFITVNFNYRLSPEYRFPAALCDINEVMCWISAHHQEYNMDISKIFMMGDSAGAQLASHYAAIITNPDFASLYPFKEHNLHISGLVLACGMYDIIHRMEKDKELITDYLGDGFIDEKHQLDVSGAITSDYPPAYIFSCPNDFLFEFCEPFAKLINSRGGNAISKIYGTKEMTDVTHVFHCNMKLPIGKQARDDMADFFLSLCRN